MTWETILPISAVEPGWVTPVQHGPRALAIFDTPAGIKVTSALCSHAGANLCDGYFSGRTIECPFHQGLFDVATGAAIGAPAVRPIKVFEARVVDGQVQIRID